MKHLMDVAEHFTGPPPDFRCLQRKLEYVYIYIRIYIYMYVYIYVVIRYRETRPASTCPGSSTYYIAYVL